jgi:hypothetical protein
MKKNELYDTIINDLPNLTADDLFDIVKKFRDEGGTKEEASKIFIKLLKKYKDGDPEYDKIADGSDFIYGWCLPQFRLWGI